MVKRNIFSLADFKNEITLLGRTRYGEEGEARLSWSASGLTFKFIGVAIAFSSMPYSGEPVTMKLEVDGVSHKFLVRSEKDIIFADGLEDCEHIVKLYKVSETDHVICFDKVTIVGKEIGIVPYKPDHKFKMEVIGDSITCGYGMYGGTPGVFETYEEDATGSYAFRAAEALGAEVRLLSYSGKGVVKSCGGLETNRFFEIFTRQDRYPGSPAFEFGDWTPDVVVVNGGTNDWSGGVTEEEFAVGIRHLYSVIRGVYPDAKLIFFYGAMRKNYDEVYKKLVEEVKEKDKNVFYRLTDYCAPDTYDWGVGGHPSYVAHIRMAKELEEEIKAVL